MPPRKTRRSNKRDRHISDKKKPISEKRFDIVSCLPILVTERILLYYLDHESLVNSTAVSRNWLRIIRSSRRLRARVRWYFKLDRLYALYMFKEYYTPSQALKRAFQDAWTFLDDASVVALIKILLTHVAMCAINTVTVKLLKWIGGLVAMVVAYFWSLCLRVVEEEPDFLTVQKFE